MDISITTFLICATLVKISAEMQRALYNTTPNTRLKGSIIRSQRTDSILTCAHYCSIENQCVSFNYKFSLRKGSCELNRQALDTPDRWRTNASFWLYAQMVMIKEKTAPPDVVVHFTHLNGKGSSGPDSTAGYEGTQLEGQVQLHNGIQIWRIPYTGTYEIMALGASGGNGTDSVGSGWRLGGKGAKVKGHFDLSKGTELKILVGQRGSPCRSFQSRPGSGGGGSFVALRNNTPLVVAGGGGGGAGIGRTPQGCKDGDPGQASVNGTRFGGTAGMGGNLYDRTTGLNPNKFGGCAGAGFYGDGKMITDFPAGETTSISFTNGGSGGVNPRGVAVGGFGGGGYAIKYPGGGGGYSGGGIVADGEAYVVAGGGGSYNGGKGQYSVGGANYGDGMVTMKLIG